MKHMTNINENLDRWFKEKWVDISKKVDGKHPPCGREAASKKHGAYPKCRPSKRVSSDTPETSGEMSKSEKESAVRQKRRAEKKSRKDKKPHMTSHKDIEEASFTPTKEFRNYVLDVITKASKTGIDLMDITKAVGAKFQLVPKIALGKLIANALEWWEESAEIVQVKGNVYKLTKWVTEQTKEAGAGGVLDEVRKSEGKIHLIKTMKISTTPGQSAFQTLYSHGFNHYIVSYSTVSDETMIFKADKTGKVTDWSDLWMSRKKEDHNEAIIDYITFSVKGNRGTKFTVVEDVSSESVSENSVDVHEENEPTDPALWSKAKSLAKSKFRVYPSAYANGWAAKWYKEHGGGWRKADTKESFAGKRFSKFVAEADQVDKESMPCNKPRSSTRPGKKRMVKGCQDGEEKIVHYGADGYGHNYSAKARESFRARHNCDQAKDKLSAQYWACKDLWAGKGGSTKSCPGGKGDSDCKY